MGSSCSKDFFFRFIVFEDFPYVIEPLLSKNLYIGTVDLVTEKIISQKNLDHYIAPCNVRVSCLLEEPRTEPRLLFFFFRLHVVCKIKQHAWLKKTQSNVSNTFLSAESLADEPKSANLMCPVRSTRRRTNSHNFKKLNWIYLELLSLPFKSKYR